jgi:hypothetical protein
MGKADAGSLSLLPIAALHFTGGFPQSLRFTSLGGSPNRCASLGVIHIEHCVFGGEAEILVESIKIMPVHSWKIGTPAKILCRNRLRYNKFQYFCSGLA